MKILVLFLLFVSFMFASVDINNAGEKELLGLNGVGAKKAKVIISYRDTNGCFSSIDDLTKVKGIGKKTVEKNRKNIELGECKK
jgi:competence protein ComEA